MRDARWVALMDSWRAAYLAPRSAVHWVASMVATTAVTMVGNWDDMTGVMLGVSMEVLMVGNWAAQMDKQWVELMDTLRVGRWVATMVA